MAKKKSNVLTTFIVTGARVLLALFIGVVLYSFGAAFVAGINDGYNSSTSFDPNNNTERNASISLCEKEAKTSNSGLSDAEINNYCKCAIAKFEQKYPDIWTNPSLQERINRDGFTKEETDLFAGCVPTT
jgi:hypothetical protein